MLNPLNTGSYDGITGALTGNGELCTTLCPTGYHIDPVLREDTVHQNHRFHIAGRRKRGAQHPMVDFGTVWRKLTVNGTPIIPHNWEQRIEVGTGTVVSETTYDGLSETTRSSVLLDSNLFLVDTILTNIGSSNLKIEYDLQYLFGEPRSGFSSRSEGPCVHMSFEIDEVLGGTWFHAVISSGDGHCDLQSTPLGATACIAAALEPGAGVVITSWLQFSDRLNYQWPVGPNELDDAVDRHEAAWRDFWDRSDVKTGDDLVDEFRRMSLYTLRCQSTPWSIPPTLARTYGDGGTFHDEMYPFFGLLSGNHSEIAQRMPYFRLATLPKAIERARGAGALYPWSSTEFGDERNPNGHRLTERFHLGQFVECIRALWLYEEDICQLEDLYPILRELARYFELNVVSRDDYGIVGTNLCTDFDESVGPVRNGPFTLSAAAMTLSFAAQAAILLGRDELRRCRWKNLADELTSTWFTKESDTWTIPDGKPIHYSVLGPIFPFRLEVESIRAKATAAHIHEICRSKGGWKPGFTEVFDGSNWMWAAAHLGIVHAWQGNADLAWEAISKAPLGAGPFTSPNEHITRYDEIKVPWFTTGCGAWLYALHAMFVMVDEGGAILLPAVPKALECVTFRDLRATRGTLVSGEVRYGKVHRLSVRASVDGEWNFRVPLNVKINEREGLKLITEDSRWRWFAIDCVQGEEVKLALGDQSDPPMFEN